MRDYINGGAVRGADEPQRASPATTPGRHPTATRATGGPAYALWVFTLFGHQDVRLLNGGRDLWISDGRDTTLDVPSKTGSGYPVVERNDAAIRAYKDDVLVPWPFDADRRALTPGVHRRAHPHAGLPGGRCAARWHIPTAVSVPWAKAADDSGRFRNRPELEQV